VSNGHYICPRCCFTPRHFAGFEESFILFNSISFSRIRINLRSSRRSSSTSPRRSSASHPYWRTPEPSPLSSYTHILHSPIAPYVRTPLVRPTLYASPGRSIPNSPARSAGRVHSSPSSHQVCHNFNYSCF
jgi:hypothetical protein